MPLKPTVSVSEAFGLPTDWSLQSSLSSAIPGSRSAEEIEKETPATETPETPAAETPAAETPAAGAETPAAAVAPAVTEKPADSPAKPSIQAKTPVVPKKDTKPAAAAKPGKPAVAATPAKPATSAAAAAPAIPAAAATPAAVVPKIKVGDKEYTQAELEAALAKSAAPAAPAATPAAASAAKPAPVVVAPTAEEKARAEAETQQKEKTWITDTAKLIEAPLDEATLDKIMAGGKDGLEAFQQMRQLDMARAVLFARKAVFQQIEPVMRALEDRVQPVLVEQNRVENERAEAQFKKDFPALVERMDVVNMVAEGMVKNEPETVAALSLPEFQKLVASRTTAFIVKMGGKVEEPAAVVATPAAGAAAAAPAAGAVVPGSIPVVPAKPARAAVKPPGANVPSTSATSGGKGGKGSDKDIIASLM